MSLAKDPFFKVVDNNVEKIETRDGLNAPPRESAHNNYTSQTFDDEGLHDELTAMNEQCIIEQQATIMDTKGVKNQQVNVEPPAVPERSTLRASKLLDSLKLNSIESARQTLTTSHDIYLSSEEDASSFGDDISDYDFDSGSESNTNESEQSSIRRKSREDTARAVSVIFVGKPCIVNLSGSRGSSSPDLSDSSSRRSVLQRRSISLGSGPNHPPRHDSISSAGSHENKPAFLNTDPFANRNYSIDSVAEQEGNDIPRTPKTPTAVLQRFQKTINLVRKRSRQNLRAGVSRDSFTGLTSASATNLLNLNTNVAAASPRPLEPQSAATMSPQSPATYTDFMRSRRGSLASNIFSVNGSTTPPPTSPATTARKSILGGLNMNRRRSLKTKSVLLP